MQPVAKLLRFDVERTVGESPLHRRSEVGRERQGERGAVELVDQRSHDGRGWLGGGVSAPTVGHIRKSSLVAEDLYGERPLQRPDELDSLEPACTELDRDIGEFGGSLANEQCRPGRDLLGELSAAGGVAVSIGLPALVDSRVAREEPEDAHFQFAVVSPSARIHSFPRPQKVCSPS